MRANVPVDEGEAEAQNPEPVVTIRLLTPDQPFPSDCRVEVDAGWQRALGGRVAMDAFLHERVVKWAQQNDWALDGEPRLAWEDVEGERCRTATFTVRGYLESP